jgi:hypothetical protein
MSVIYFRLIFDQKRLGSYYSTKVIFRPFYTQNVFQNLFYSKINLKYIADIVFDLRNDFHSIFINKLAFKTLYATLNGRFP